MVLLQAVIERITGMSLDNVRRRAHLPAARHGRHALHAGHQRPRATARASRRHGGHAARRPAQGIVHDANAWAMGGVSGHAGLFSLGARPRDLRADASRRRHFDDVRIVAPQTLARWTAPQDRRSSRALGWDTPAPGVERGTLFLAAQLRPHGLHRHLALDRPGAGLFVVLLMNRVNPRGEGTRHVQLRRDVADAVQRAVLDAPLVDWEELR